MKDSPEDLLSEPLGVDHFTAPGHLLRRIQQVHTEAWSRLVGKVTGPQYAVMVCVTGWPGIDQKQVGELASLDKSTAAGIIARLVDGGWLSRASDHQDRRRRRLGLTRKSAASLPEITQAARAVQAELLAPLAEPVRERFVDALARVARLSESGIRTQRIDSRVLVMARTPGYLIRRAQQIHTSVWAERVRDVTGPQYAVLAAVLRSGVATYAQIGTHASLDSSSTRDIVSRLVERGWLEAAENPADRRSRPVRVTAPATTAIRLLREPVLTVQNYILEPLEGSERSDFIALLQQVAGIASRDPCRRSPA